MTRIAYLSPLPPEPSGIADYSAELIPQLAAYFDIELFTSRPREAPATLRREFPIHSYSRFESEARSERFDHILYQMGNSAEAHADIFEHLIRRPGVVVLHEYMLHHLMRAMTLRRGGIRAYVEEMRYCYGETGAAIARGLLDAGTPPDLWAYPLFERVVDASLGLIVHSAATAERVRASRPQAKISRVPHHLALHDTIPASEEARAQFRSSLGLAPEAFLVASFGHLNTAKCLPAAVRAFARFRQNRPGANYLLMGEIPADHAELREMLAGEEGAGVLVTGRVPLPRLLEGMACCDVAVNLRRPTGGETSGACIRLLGLGLPVVVSNRGWFAEIPPDCCIHLEGGVAEEEHLLALLEALAANPDLRTALGENARHWAVEQHRVENSAVGYRDFLHDIAAKPPVPFQAVPPLAPWPPGDISAALASDLAGVLGELGLGVAEEAPKRLLAELMVDLGLDSNGTVGIG